MEHRETCKHSFLPSRILSRYFHEKFHFSRNKTNRKSTMRFTQLLKRVMTPVILFLRGIKSLFNSNIFFIPSPEGIYWLSNETCICHSILSGIHAIQRGTKSHEKGTIECIGSCTRADMIELFMSRRRMSLVRMV